MSVPFLGEIRMFSGNFPPVDWALCNGQLINISDNDALYTLLGTTYGGDGQTTFALPDLQGRIPIHHNAKYALGAKGGTETVTLTAGQMASHTHTPLAGSQAGSQSAPGQNTWAVTPGRIYSDGNGQTLVPMNPQLISAAGGSMPHDNMMPSLTITFIIALTGIYPPQG